MNNKYYRKPEDIQKDIDKLKKELNLSKQYYEYEFVCDDEWTKDMIGFFNMGNGRKILELLNMGEQLQYRHNIYGVIDVNMNPQRNRILVSKNEYITEENILTFVFRASGEWFLKK